MEPDARSSTGRAVAWMLVLVVLAVVAAGCSREGDEGPESGAGGIPSSLSAAESAAEDSIDLILAGNRSGTVKQAKGLDTLAEGDLARDLAKVATPEEIADLQRRAQDFAKVAPDGEPIAGFTGRFGGPVPGDVGVLDYLDFQAKLTALAHDGGEVRAVVDRLDRTWGGLEPDVRARRSTAGGAVADAFGAHVTAMKGLAAVTDYDRLAKEAQHGLDLVDEIEAVYLG
jgi:hypothetical protein